MAGLVPSKTSVLGWQMAPPLLSVLSSEDACFSSGKAKVLICGLLCCFVVFKLGPMK